MLEHWNDHSLRRVVMVCRREGFTGILRDLLPCTHGSIEINHRVRNRIAANDEQNRTDYSSRWCDAVASVRVRMCFGIDYQAIRRYNFIPSRTASSQRDEHVREKRGPMTPTAECAHPARNCVPANGESYCSETCADAKRIIEIACQCQHPTCQVEQLKP